MTVRMRLRRWARAQGKRRAAARTKRSAAAGSRRREQQPSGASQLSRGAGLAAAGADLASAWFMAVIIAPCAPYRKPHARRQASWTRRSWS